MINVQRSKEVFGLKSINRIPKKQKVICNCDVCGVESRITKQHHYICSKRAGLYRCKDCGRKAMASKVSKAMISKWQNDKYKSKQIGRTHSDELKEYARQRAIKLWKDKEYVAKYNAGFDPAKARKNLKATRSVANKAASLAMADKWQEKEYRSKMSDQSAKLWSNDCYRNKVISSLKKHYSSLEVLDRCSNRAKKLWKNNDYRDRWFKSFMQSFGNERLHEISLQSAKNWGDREYRDKIESQWDDQKRAEMSEICKEWWTDDRRAEVSEIMISRWSDPNFRKKTIKAFIDSWTEERRQAAKDSWTEERRQAASDRSRNLWKDPKYVSKMVDMIGRPSSLEIQFASLLDDYGIEYTQQFHLGPYLFDFKVNDVLIEINGDYWHRLPKTISKDKAKATYVEKHYQQYQLKYLWEHEFYQLEKINKFIEFSFVGSDVEEVDFSELKFVTDIDYDSIKSLIEKYHYKGSIGRGGVYYGVIYRGNLIAGSVVGSPTRNVVGGELLRFVIHPQYQVKNLASWFLSRISKHALRDYDLLFTFADPNFNNYGTIYEASGWEFAGETKSDYWYVSEDGWVMHKKTLWNRAKNLCMSERYFAEVFGYNRVYGLPKRKYIKH